MLKLRLTIALAYWLLLAAGQAPPLAASRFAPKFVSYRVDTRRGALRLYYRRRADASVAWAACAARWPPTTSASTSP